MGVGQSNICYEYDKTLDLSSMYLYCVYMLYFAVQDVPSALRSRVTIPTVKSHVVKFLSAAVIHTYNFEKTALCFISALNTVFL